MPKSKVSTGKKTAYIKWSQLHGEAMCTTSGKAGRTRLPYELLAKKATVGLKNIQEIFIALGC